MRVANAGSPDHVAWVFEQDIYAMEKEVLWSLFVFSGVVRIFPFHVLVLASIPDGLCRHRDQVQRIERNSTTSPFFPFLKPSPMPTYVCCRPFVEASQVDSRTKCSLNHRVKGLLPFAAAFLCQFSRLSTGYARFRKVSVQPTSPSTPEKKKKGGGCSCQRESREWEANSMIDNSHCPTVPLSKQTWSVSMVNTMPL